MRRVGVVLAAMLSILTAVTACKQAGSVRLSDEQSSSFPPSDLWDDQMAATVVGKVVLIGLTHPARGDTPVSYEQMHGVVAEADRKRGFRVRLQGARAGSDYWLPPQTTSFIAAQPGVYKLRSTGEEVENPDYISNWTIEAPKG